MKIIQHNFLTSPVLVPGLNLNSQLKLLSTHTSTSTRNRHPTTQPHLVRRGTKQILCIII